jgi:DNA-binding NarL/FixJ family response regulator
MPDSLPQPGPKTTETIQVLIVEDDDLIARHYRMALAKDGQINIVGRAANGYEAVMLAGLYKPDVILMDIELEEKNAGLHATEEILSYLPDTKIVVLTVCETDETVFSAFQLGVTNYLLKNTPSHALIETVKDAYYDRSSIRADIAGKLKREFKRIKGNEGSLINTFLIISQLTPSELENLELFLKGLSRAEICAHRHIEYSTLKSQIFSILKKFRKDRLEDVIEVLREVRFLDIIGKIKAQGDKTTG